MTKNVTTARLRKLARAAGYTVDGTFERDDDPKETVEVHNHWDDPPENHVVTGEEIAPRGEQRDEGDESEIIERYPGHYHATVEDGELVIRKRAPDSSKSDRHEMGGRTADRRPPRTLREVNAFMRGHYGRAQRTAAR